MLTANQAAIGLAVETLERPQTERPHPVRLVLHLRHLADDRLGQTLLRLEDVVLYVAPAERVPT